MLEPYKGLDIPEPKSSQVKRRYSVTADIVSFRRCPRQYGTFRVHNYAPAHQTQLYFGNIIHQVLDRCHAHYQGIVDPSTKDQIPAGGEILSEDEIADYFLERRSALKSSTTLPPVPNDIVAFFIEVESGLKSQGITAVTPDLRIRALSVLQYFNALEGPELYPLVIDSEYRLQADRGDHIVHGVVDLLVGSKDDEEIPANYEIWDYKGTSRTTLTRDDLETYQFQMRVYARLYELKNGVRPKKAILYLMNELYEKGAPPPTRRPANAMLSVDLEPDSEIERAVTEFTQTVHDIEAARKVDVWPAIDPDKMNKNDCAICDLRWDCPTGKPDTYRYP